MKTFILVTILMFGNASWGNEFCRISTTDLSPSVGVKVSQDTNGIYTYDYKLTAEKESKFPLSFFWVKFGGSMEDIIAPKGWQVSRDKSKMIAGFGPDKKFLQWSRDGQSPMLAPGQSLSGFRVNSKKKPILSMAKIATLATGSKVIYTEVKKEKGKPCPGVWDEITTNTEPFVRVLTLGPGSDDQISFQMFIRPSPDHQWSGAYDDSKDGHYAFSPFDKNDIEVLVVSGENQNVSDLNIESLRFGRGNAKVKTVKKEMIEKQNFAFNEHANLLAGKEALVLSFSAMDVNPLCNVDLALFLTGKMKSGKSLYTGVSVKKNPCNEANWKLEAEKILKKERDMKHVH